VTVEDSPVEILSATDPLLNFPNKIVQSDFDGWVQERGLYFPSEWDSKYKTVIASNDPGEKSLAGGILYCNYGRGAYVYTSYSWFRQLPAGVPGALRIFANLVSAGKLRGDVWDVGRTSRSARALQSPLTHSTYTAGAVRSNEHMDRTRRALGLRPGKKNRRHFLARGAGSTLPS